MEYSFSRNSGKRTNRTSAAVRNTVDRVTQKSFIRLHVASPNDESPQLADEPVKHNHLDLVM